MTTIEPDTQLAELMQFVDEHPELSEDELLDEIEKRFPREVIDAFTAALAGITPAPR
jgi:hypothetical protein